MPTLASECCVMLQVLGDSCSGDSFCIDFLLHLQHSCILAYPCTLLYHSLQHHYEEADNGWPVFLINLSLSYPPFFLFPAHGSLQVPAVLLWQETIQGKGNCCILVLIFLALVYTVPT